MKKLFFLFSLSMLNLLSAQELSADQKKMIKNDDTLVFSNNVTKENINLCYNLEENSYSLLALSIKMNSPNIFQKLLDANADLEKTCDGKTPLMFAAKYGNAAFVKKLMEKGAKKEAKTEKGYTAFDYAKKYNQYEIMKILE